MLLNNIKCCIVIAICIISQMLNAQTYQSIVCDSITQNPIQYVIVSLCSNKGEILRSTVTNSGGIFKLENVKNAALMQFSFVGYHKLQKVLINSSLPEKLYLSPIALKDVVVTANYELHDIDKDSYIINDSLRKGTTFAADMLGNLKGITYNWYDNSISIFGQKNILLLVNGIEKNDDYIKNINPKRIQKVEVIHNPGGRYVSDNYAAIINLILYEDYIGWDLNLADNTKINSNKLDKYEWLFNEEVNPNFTYTSNKITVNASSNYSQKRMSFFDTYKEIYPGIIENFSRPIDGQVPNLKKEESNYLLSSGLDYEISKKHSLSFQGKYFSGNENTNFNYLIQTSGANNVLNSSQRTGQINGKPQEWIGTLFYQGKIGEHLTLYSDFNYDYYLKNSVSNITQENWLSTGYKYRNWKNFTRFNIDITYTFKNDASLKIGYSNAWKEYLSKNLSSGIQESQSENYRDRFFSYYSYKFDKNLSVSLGGALEKIHYQNNDTASSYLAFIPDFKLMYKPTKSIDAVLQYYTTIDYPTLAQSSIYTFRTDSLMSSSGNPYLTQALYNNALFRLRLFNSLTINSTYCYSKNNITPFYELKNDNLILNTYVNSMLNKFSASVSYETLFLKYFILSTNMSFEHDKISYSGNTNTCNTWGNESFLMYMNRKKGFRAMLYYTSKNRNDLSLQGIQKGGESFWMISMMKSCCNDKLSLSAMYILPIKWLLYTTEGRSVNTEYYQYNSSINTFDDLMKNMIMLKINYRLDHGKRTIKNEYKATVDHE